MKRIFLVGDVSVTDEFILKIQDDIQQRRIAAKLMFSRQSYTVRYGEHDISVHVKDKFSFNDIVPIPSDIIIFAFSTAKSEDEMIEKTCDLSKKNIPNVNYVFGRDESPSVFLFKIAFDIEINLSLEIKKVADKLKVVGFKYNSGTSMAGNPELNHVEAVASNKLRR